MDEHRWLGAVEGYYGPPLTHADRVELIGWLGEHGFNAYAYAPKDDPYHRAAWRDPYPDDRRDEFAELVAAGSAAGVDVVLVVSPGLDWAPGDEDALAAKLASFAEQGARTLGVAFDDVPPGGADLGAMHGRAIAAAAERLDGDFRWITCPTDYATDHATDYLKAYVAELPERAESMWTGPSIVSPRVDAHLASAMAEQLGRPVLFAENYPVNDGPMAGVLHLGPYRGRDPGLPAATSGVFFNFMPLARASRIGLAAGARFWLEPTVDGEQAWREVIAGVQGLEPIALASRSWIGDTGPSAEVAGWVDAAIAGDYASLRAYIDTDVRAGLDPVLAAEIEPWLEQWDAEALAMRYAMMLMEEPQKWGPGGTFAVSEAWARARAGRQQLFGIRFAAYPLTARDGEREVALREGLVIGENLTDQLCATALERVGR